MCAYVPRSHVTLHNQNTPSVISITNPGSVTTKQVVELLQQHLTPERSFKFFENEDEFMQKAARTPRSNCVLDSSKIIQAGITLRPAEEAIIHSLNNWSANQN